VLLEQLFCSCQSTYTTGNYIWHLNQKWDKVQKNCSDIVEDCDGNAAAAADDDADDDTKEKRLLIGVSMCNKR
jgi:hypothetical protein